MVPFEYMMILMHVTYKIIIFCFNWKMFLIIHIKNRLVIKVSFFVLKKVKICDL